MKNQLESRFVLSVFDKIRQFGQQQDNGYLLDGLKAWSDPEGYNLYVEDALVQLHYGFHNQYHLEYQSQEHFEQFEKKMQHIHATY